MSSFTEIQVTFLTLMMTPDLPVPQAAKNYLPCQVILMRRSRRSKILPKCQLLLKEPLHQMSTICKYRIIKNIHINWNNSYYVEDPAVFGMLSSFFLRPPTSTLQWDKFDDYIEKCSKHVSQISGDGFCFLYSLEMALLTETDILLTSAQMKVIIMGHLKVHCKEYSKFYSGNLVEDAALFFQSGVFDKDVVDIIISSAAKALNLNLYIYEKGEKGEVVVLDQFVHPSCVTVHLKFTHDNKAPLGNHYEPIICNPEVTETFSESLPKVSSLGPIQDTPLDLTTSQCSHDLTPPASMEQVSPEKSVKEIGLDEGCNDYFFPIHLFRNVEPEWVDSIPPDIDGKKFYQIRTDIQTFNAKARDMHHFKMNTSKTGTNTIKRKTGHCQGNLFCPNPQCTFLKTNKNNVENMSQWQHPQKGITTCYSCGFIAQSTKCPARKMSVFNTQSRVLQVFHVGHHICQKKKQTDKYRKEAEEVIRHNPYAAGGSTGRRNYITYKCATEGVNAAYKAGRATTTPACQVARRALTVEQNPRNQSFESLALYREDLVKKDPFLIYKINQHAFNGDPDYVFKSAREMAQLALQMDQNNTVENPLMNEEAYFDGAHKRCIGFKTLGLFVYHPALRKILKLASMEVRSEDTVNIALFFKLFNEILSKVNGSPIAFNPKGIMVDEAGGNFQGIRQVFGQDYLDEKVVSCQLHFKKNVHNKSFRIPESYRQEFVSICFDLCRAATVQKYNEIQGILTEFGNLFPDIRHWIEWWDIRKYHVFTPFRRFGYSNVTFAEAGHSSGRRATMLWLLEACKDDVSAMIMQISDLENFFNQTGTVCGKGPTALQKSAMARNEQLHLAKEFGSEFLSQTGLQEEREEMLSGCRFIPSASSSHKPKRKQSLEGKKVSQAKKPKKQRTKGKKAVVGVDRQLQIARDVLLDSSISVVNNGVHPCVDCAENKPVYIEEANRYNPKSNNPHIALFLGLNISKCKGCSHKIDRSIYPAPMDVCLRMQGVRRYKDARLGIVKSHWGNIYFHLDLTCLEHHHPDIKMEHITIAKDTLVLLTPDHFKFLKEKGFLQVILNNLQQ